jgi:hypothetical protein
VNADDGTGVLDSGIVLFVIMLFVFVGIAAAIFPVGQEFEAEEGAFEYVALFAFILEMSLRMFAMGIGEYLRDRMCFMDFVVVMIDILLLTLEDYFGDFSAVQTNSTGGGSFGGLEHTNVLKSLRLLRFVRLVRLRRVFKAAAERLKKQEKGETLSEQDIKQFEDLFRKEEREAVNNKDNFGAALELNLMSKREPLAAICLDLLMYQSDSLFEAAFFSLERFFCQRKALVDAVSAVQLVPRQQENSMALMEEDLHLLRESISSFAIWARGSGKGDLSQGERVLDTLGKLTEVCSGHRIGRERVDDGDELGIVWDRAPGWRRYGATPDSTRPPNAANQALLRKLGVHDVVLQAIQLRPATGADNAGGESRVDDEVKLIVAQIQSASADYIREFARGNLRGRRVAAKHVLTYALIARHADGQAQKASSRRKLQGQCCFIVLGDSIDKLLLSLLYQNRRLCEGLSDDVLRALTELLQRRVQWCAFTQAERLLEIFTVIFMHENQPVRDLQERVLHATTSRATVKKICFDPFLKEDKKPSGDGKEANEIAGPRLLYQVAVINFFSDMCIGHSVVCEAVLHKMLPLDSALDMLGSIDSKLNLLQSSDRRNSADPRMPLGVLDEGEEKSESNSGSDSEDEEVEELLDMGSQDAWLQVGKSVASTSELPAQEREQNLMYQTRGSLSRFIAESYFETLEVQQQELKLDMLQNDALWGFIERSVQLIKRVPSNQKRWQVGGQRTQVGTNLVGHGTKNIHWQYTLQYNTHLQPYPLPHPRPHPHPHPHPHSHHRCRQPPTSIQTAGYTDCVGQTTFALTLFYDYVVRHGSLLDYNDGALDMA